MRNVALIEAPKTNILNPEGIKDFSVRLADAVQKQHDKKGSRWCLVGIAASSLEILLRRL
jgi:hypothetical protein